MKVNMRGAASNCYSGVKALIDVIEKYEDDENKLCTETVDLIDDLNNVLVRFQPLLAAYSINCHFNEEENK